jgi:hypothetical protein
MTDSNRSLWDQLCDHFAQEDGSEAWFLKREQLYEARDREKADERPFATCCSRSKLLRASMRSGPNLPPSWVQDFAHAELRWVKKQEWVQALGSFQQEILFCPFCGTKLPSFRLKRSFPPRMKGERVLVSRGLSFYGEEEPNLRCVHCQQYDDCICSEPIARWEAFYHDGLEV